MQPLEKAPNTPITAPFPPRGKAGAPSRQNCRCVRIPPPQTRRRLKLNITNTSREKKSGNLKIYPYRYLFDLQVCYGCTDTITWPQQRKSTSWAPPSKSFAAPRSGRRRISPEPASFWGGTSCERPSSK